jgi:hypothetical protein
MVKRARTERRREARDAAKLARARMRLAELEPGGAPDRPIEVKSASTIEIHAESQPCAACGAGNVRVEDHVVADGARLRVAKVTCPRCGVRRDVFFRIGTALPS